MPEPSYDVVTIGETMIRLSPPGFDRLEQSSDLKLHVGGSESNTAVGLARLGLRTAWVSRLTDNPLGHLIANTLRIHGVDTSHIVWTPNDRVGLYFLENGSPPRSSQVVYDRANSAFTKLCVSDFDIESICRCKHLHLTGISAALGDSVRITLRSAAEYAQSHGGTVSFDMNYRARLWTIDEARRSCEFYFREADIVFLAKRDAIQVWNSPPNGSNEEILKSLDRYRQGKLTVMTLGDQGAVAMIGNRIRFAPTKPVPIVDRLGGGDAFAAGFLYRWITTKEFETALQWGNAMAGLKYSIPGDMPIVTQSEVERVLTETTSLGIQR